MCVVNLRTDLSPTSDAGGAWFYLGYSSNPTGPFGGGAANPLVPLTPPALIAGGDDPSVDTEGVTAGFYRFIYRVGANPCQDLKNLTIEVADIACVGEDTDIIVCSDDADFAVVDAMSEGCQAVETPGSPLIAATTPNGTWNSYVSGGKTFFDVDNNDFGTYVINNYTSTTTEFAVHPDCDNCLPEANLTVELREANMNISEAQSPFYDLVCDPSIPGSCEINLQTLLNIGPPTNTNPAALQAKWQFRGFRSPDGITQTPGPSVTRSLKATGTGVLPARNGIFAPYGGSGNISLVSNIADVLVDFSQVTSGEIYRMQYEYPNVGFDCFQAWDIDIRVTHTSVCLSCGDGAFTQADYVTDLNMETLAIEFASDPVSTNAFVNQWGILSFIVDGVELAPNFVPLGDCTFTVINGRDYLTNIVDRLNEFNVPDMTFSYTGTLDINGRTRFINVKAGDHLVSTCPTWEFRIGTQTNSFLEMVYTSTQITRSGTVVSNPIVNGTATWPQNVGYPQNAIENYTTGDDCP